MEDAKRALRNLGLLAGLVALGAAGWWSLRGGGAHGDEAAAPRAETASAAERPEAAMAAPAAGAGERIALAEVAPEEEQAPAAEPARTTWPASAVAKTEPSPAEIPIEGTIVVTDPEGGEHPYESGSMTIVVWHGHSGGHQAVVSGDYQPVDVVNGRWKATVAEDAELAFGGMALGGLWAGSEHDDNLPIPTSRFLAVRARWPPASTLRVRSAETHQDLTGIEIVLGGGSGSGMQHPGSYGATDVLAANASSPIDLGRVMAGRDHGRTLFVRAPGFAWGEIEVDLASGGERLIDLVPGGALRVAVSGRVPDEARLRVRRDGTPLEAELEGTREVELGSLLPGSCTVSVEVGEWFQDPVVLGSASAEILAGGLTRVTIEVAAPAKVATAHLKCTLVVDPAWGEVAPAVTVESIGTPPDGRRISRHFSSEKLKPVPGAVNTWTFYVGRVPQGSYEFEIDEPFWLLSRAVDAATDGVRLEVPGPAVAEIRAVDKDGVELAEVTALHWNPVRSGGGFSRAATRDPASGRFEIRAPSGSIEISVTGIELRGSHVYDLQPGRQAFDFVVSRNVGFTLALRDGETKLPLSWGSLDEPREVGGDGTIVCLGMDARGMLVAVTRPGRYRFTVPAVPGYEPIPEQEVLVPEQGFAEHVVQLVRSP